MQEHPRLLHARSEHGYTSRQAEALPGEPEAVSAETQRRLTRQAGDRASQRRRSEWLAVRDRWAVELEQLLRSYGREAGEELRLLQRGLERVDRKLA